MKIWYQEIGLQAWFETSQLACEPILFNIQTQMWYGNLKALLYNTETEECTLQWSRRHNLHSSFWKNRRFRIFFNEGKCIISQSFVSYIHSKTFLEGIFKLKTKMSTSWLKRKSQGTNIIQIIRIHPLWTLFLLYRSENSVIFEAL